MLSGHVALVGGEQNTYGVWLGKAAGRSALGRASIDGKIISRLILKK
jgi:hypothetical protein